MPPSYSLASPATNQDKEDFPAYNFIIRSGFWKYANTPVTGVKASYSDYRALMGELAVILPLCTVRRQTCRVR